METLHSHSKEISHQNLYNHTRDFCLRGWDGTSATGLRMTDAALVSLRNIDQAPLVSPARVLAPSPPQPCRCWPPASPLQHSTQTCHATGKGDTAARLQGLLLGNFEVFVFHFISNNLDNTVFCPLLLPLYQGLSVKGGFNFCNTMLLKSTQTLRALVERTGLHQHIFLSCFKLPASIAHTLITTMVESSLHTQEQQLALRSLYP